MNFRRPFWFFTLVSASLAAGALGSCSTDTAGDGAREVDNNNSDVSKGPHDGGGGNADDPRDGGGTQRDASARFDASAPSESDAAPSAGESTTDAAVEGEGGAANQGCGSRGSAVCSAKQYCSFEAAAACGEADQGGVCKARPTLCPDIYYGVCGCDGKTYANDCQAERAGVSVKAMGACGGTVERTPGKTCGGIAALKCAAGSFCSYGTTAAPSCGADFPDQAGVCVVKPGLCTQDYKPVCGCDHHSYGNACEAHAAGSSVARDDLCTELDCKALAGEVTYGTGPAAVCPVGTVSAGAVRLSSGALPIEGALCCVKP